MSNGSTFNDYVTTTGGSFNNDSGCERWYDIMKLNTTSGLYDALKYRGDPCQMNDPCSPRHMCQHFPTETGVPINGYISPILIFMTIINNTLVSVVLLGKKMRTPTNNLLVSMAIADTLTGVFALPIYLHFYSTDNHRDYVPYEWCYVYQYVHVLLPTIFHTASVWLTVGLAVQRYIYVCHSFLAKSVCTTRNVIIGTAVIYLVSTTIHLSRFFDTSLSEIRVVSLVDPHKIVDSCTSDMSQWVYDTKPRVYYNIYFWGRVVLIHLIPCTSLIVLNLILIIAMRRAQQRRKILLKQNRRSECKRLKDSNCTTLMLIAVVGMFLLVEFPLGIIILLHIIMNTFNIVIMPGDILPNLMLFANLFILVSYPLNFFIYCGMSRQFRSSFKNLFIKSDSTDADGCMYSQYQTLQTENGKTTAVTTTHV